MYKRSVRTKAITIKELKKIMSSLLNANDRQGYDLFVRIRNCMAFSFQFFLGLRPKECFDSKIYHLSLRDKTLFIPAMNNKQRNQDIMDIPDFVINQLLNYLDYRRWFFPKSPWLFPSRSKAGRLSRSSYARIFRTALIDAGLHQVTRIDSRGLKKSNYTPYSLRAGFASLVYIRTGDIRKTSVALRHKDPLMRTAWRYVRVNDDLIRKRIIEEIYDPSYKTLYDNSDNLYD